MNPLFFLHGFTGSKYSWNEIQHLVKFKTHAIDLPGHGKNYFKSLSNNYSFKNWDQEFLSILNNTKVDKINLCGYSMGGRLAISFATAFPEKVNSLILISSTAGLLNNSENKNRLIQDNKLSKDIELDYNKFIDNWENLDFFSKQKLRNPNGFIRQRVIRKSQNPQQLALSLQNLGLGNMPNYWNDIPYFNFPVLIICGDEDKKYNKISSQLHSKINNSIIKIIPNSGHAPQIDQPIITSKLIQKFIKS